MTIEIDKDLAITIDGRELARHIECRDHVPFKVKGRTEKDSRNLLDRALTLRRRGATYDLIAERLQIGRDTARMLVTVRKAMQHRVGFCPICGSRL